MSTLLQDLKYGLRQLGRNPVFTAVAVLTLALGIGANTAVFSVMNAVLLRYLPVPNPQQLVYLHTDGMPSGASETGNPPNTFNMASFEQFRNEHQVFQSLAAFAPLAVGKVPIRSGEEPETASVDMVSGNFFSGLGVRLERGRAFTAEDETAHTQAAVLSYNYWTRQFARNPSAIGQTIYIKSVPFTIIGVAMHDFTGVEPDETSTDVWVPFQTRPDLKPWGRSPQSNEGLYSPPNWWFLMMIGRLQPGITWQRAIAQLQPTYSRAAYEGIGERSAKERTPQLYFSATGGIQKLRENYENPFLVLMAMVAIVMLIACINVAMLLIARNAVREREFTMRVALGASRGRLFRQLLAEGLLLVAAGSVFAWIFALWATQALAAWSELSVDVAPDGAVLLFTLGLGLLTAVVLGLAPLRNAWRVPSGLALKAAGTVAGPGRSRLRAGQAIVALQIALCLALLLGAGLMLRSLRNLENANLGFRASGLLVFGVTPPRNVHTDAETLHFWQSLLDRMRALPGVESATLTGLRIGSGWSNNKDVLVDGRNPRGNLGSMVRWNDVGPDFCHVLGIPLLEGRDFSDADSAAAPKVAIINRTFAERYLAGRSPIGHLVELAKGQPFTIVGVVADSKYTSVRENSIPIAYFPYTQMSIGATMTVELRAGSHPLALLPEARREVAQFGPDIPLLQPMTQQAQMEEGYSEEQMFARLAVLFGLLAGLLVAAGLYGTVAYKVSRRTQEIGIRMALGAQRRQVLWMVLRESVVVALAGVAIGLPLALAGGKLLGSMLFGVKTTDPLSIMGALAGVTLLAVVASMVPARRAAKVDPMVALRYE
ncbi:MAG: ABC transporter permease [Acidobacteria bacterium]|nr:MAG: ABC transporter permease [Acidobacteriota bacterium]